MSDTMQRNPRCTVAATMTNSWTKIGLGVLAVALVCASCKTKEDNDFWGGDAGNEGPEVALSPDPSDSTTRAPDRKARTTSPGVKRVDDVPRMADGRPLSFVDIVKAANPSVVNIYTTVVVRDRPSRLDPYFPFVPRERLGSSLGTGFVVDKDGYILTNHHVIAKASQIRVRTHDDRQLSARIVGSDPKTDIALIVVEEPEGLVPLVLGDSDKLEVGEWVLAIGNALGLQSSVTAGIVSATGRSDVPVGEVAYMDFIQTDASINPGNSGGPLLNLAGEVVGINTAISREGQGIGFAIPSSMVKVIYPQLRKFGKVNRSWLGIYVRPVTDDVARSAGLPSASGAVVRRVVEGGPAQTAGLAVGDVIVKFDGEGVADISDLRWKSSVAGVGQKVRLTVRRGDKELDLDLIMAKNPYD